MRRPLLLALSAIAIAATGACGEQKGAGDPGAAGAGASPAQVSANTLAAEVDKNATLGTVAAALKGTGLASVFDGSAPYTILAPGDAAFDALGPTAAILKAPENGAAMAGVLRAHILPGYLTLKDIDAALAKAGGKPVTMTTMAGSEVSFTRDGEALKITAADGATATVNGAEVLASNGVAIPIGAVLKKIPDAPGA